MFIIISFYSHQSPILTSALCTVLTRKLCLTQRSNKAHHRRASFPTSGWKAGYQGNDSNYPWRAGLWFNCSNCYTDRNSAHHDASHYLTPIGLAHQLSRKTQNQNQPRIWKLRHSHPAEATKVSLNSLHSKSGLQQKEAWQMRDPAFPDADTKTTAQEKLPSNHIARTTQAGFRLLTAVSEWAEHHVYRALHLTAPDFDELSVAKFCVGHLSIAISLIGRWCASTVVLLCK